MTREQKNAYHAEYIKRARHKEYLRKYFSDPQVAERRRTYQREYARKQALLHPEKTRERRRKANLAGRDRRLIYGRSYSESMKVSAINIYSNGDACCAICRIADMDVLCLDHIANDGKAHRELIKSEMKTLYGHYHWCKKNDYPAGFQVLCFNCNMKKEIERRRSLRRMTAAE